uniref:IFT27 putative n=1 Tax=Albugo laibachii Nc14 TaxID=890382 RepID=F0WZZ3_9STRA|nr:IFT27 putative [Albugo laibachii Nc14]|eukprot:CCA27074.1 IFT27 putative [Albugo laibachii Nc14]
MTIMMTTRQPSSNWGPRSAQHYKLINMSAVRSMETTHRSTTVLRCKVAIVGDATVGKTALVQVYKSGGQEFPKNYLTTIDVELSVKSVRIPNTNVIVELFLIDCPGQSVFNQREFGASHYEGASMVMIVFDVSNKESYKSISKWLQVVKDASEKHKVTGVLVGAKTDLRRPNILDSVTSNDAQEWAKTNEMEYFELSAHQNTDIEAPFLHIAETFYRKYQKAVEGA